MADAKITELSELAATPDDADLLPIVDDVAGTPTTKKITVANLKAAGGGATALTIAPLPSYPHDNVSDFTANSNTTGYTGAFVLPFEITVNKISIDVISSATAGTAKIGIYSEDGQTKEIDLTTATISSSGVKTYTLGAPVTLSAGIHYLVFVPISTFSASLRVWLAAASTVMNNITSEPVLAGNQTVTAGTLPTTFDPTSDITSNPSRFLLLRLDN